MADAHYPFAGQIHWARTVQLCAAMAAINAQAADVCAGLTEAQLSLHKRPGSWSIAQNLAHLRTTTAVFLPTIDLALAESKKRNLFSAGPFGLTPYGRLLIWQMDARPMIKLRAPRAIHPQLLPSATLELEHFLSSQSAMRQRIEEAEGLHLTALRFASPLVKQIRMNLLEFFSVLNAHSRRHLRQASRVRETVLNAGRAPMQNTL